MTIQNKTMLITYSDSLGKNLKELNEKGITIIMVTHNMNLCDCFSRVINVENFRQFAKIVLLM